MKVKTCEKISPVEIILETQEEIDQLYAILNYTPIMNAIGNDSPDWFKVRNALANQRSENYTTWHNKLRDDLGRN